MYATKTPRRADFGKLLLSTHLGSWCPDFGCLGEIRSRYAMFPMIDRFNQAEPSEHELGGICEFNLAREHASPSRRPKTDLEGLTSSATRIAS